MRILITTWGSRGDFQPFIALGLRLQARGHAVTIGGLPYAAPWVLAAGLEFAPAGPDDHTQAELNAGASRLFAMSDPLRSARSLVYDFLAPGLAQAYRDLAPRVPPVDLIVSHHIQAVGHMLAERYAKPLVTASFAPHILPTRAYPPLWLPNLGALPNRTFWWAGSFFMRWTADGAINRVRAELGFPPIRNFFQHASYSDRLHLIPVSPHVYPRPFDWPPSVSVSGYWFLDPPSAFVLPPGLEAFLAAGPAPILITFGSMPAPDLAEMNRLLLAAVRQAGVRAVIQEGWAGLGTQLAVPPDVFVAGDVPHAWLMPRVAAVVHHAGAGTTAAALRAGLPSVLVPHFADQPAWSLTVHRLGVSPPDIPRSRLTAERLAGAIRQAMTDAPMRARAAALGEAIRGEDGLGEAVRLIEAAAG